MHLFHSEAWCHSMGSLLTAGVGEMLHCDKSLNALENIAEWLASHK